MNRIILLVFILLVPYRLFSQCPVPGFTLPLAACADDTISTVNTSSGAVSYSWDFCAGDLGKTPTVTSYGNIEGALDFPTSISLVHDGTNWYGFVKNFQIDPLIRLNYGASLDNTPTVDTVDILLGGLSNHGSYGKINFIQEGGNWYGITTSISSRLLRLEFGNSLANNTINATAFINDPVIYSSPYDVDILWDNDSLYALVANLTSNNISVVNFGTSVTNNPVNGYQISTLVGEILGVASINIAKSCDNIVAIVSAISDDTTARLDFGSSLHANPVMDKLGRFENPFSVQLEYENDHWYAYIMQRHFNGIDRLDFGDDLTNPNPIRTNLGNFGFGFATAYSLVIEPEGSEWYGFVVNTGTNESLFKVVFPDTCSAVVDTSSHFEPEVTYTEGGSYYINLITEDANGNVSSFTDTMVISDRPDPDFSATEVCIGDSTLFTDLSTSNDTINSWFWDFGDGNTSSDSQPKNLYADTGDYQVKLLVNTVSGCPDSITKTVSIKAFPVASFIIDSVCADNLVTIVNNSTVIDDSITSWKWEFGNGDSSFVEVPQYAYDSGGSYTVTLVAISSNQCTDTTTNQVFIKDNPVVDFEISNTCVGSQTQFQNLSTFGTNFSSFWDFDDGNFSSQQNAINIFADTGNYNVELLITGDNGCTDSLTKDIRISFVPQVSFSVTPSIYCQFNSLQFIDNSVVVGDTVNSWHWNFANDSSFIQHPAKTFNQFGPTPITLTVSTGIDCDSSITDTLNIIESPVANFNVDSLCFGDEAVFKDNSYVPTGHTISSVQWNFGDNTSSTVFEPSHVFPDSATYQVTYTVTTDSGCSSTLSQPISIVQLPEAVALFSGPFCSDLSTDFTNASNSSPNDPVIFSHWKFEQNLATISDTTLDNDPTYIFDTSGIYSVQLSVETSNGCKDTLSTSINVKSSPVVSFFADSACLGDTTDFIDNYSGSNFLWSWDFGDGRTSLIDDPTHIYDSAGIYPVFLQLTDQVSQCFDTLTNPVKVRARPTPAFDGSQVCANTPHLFVDQSTTTDVNDSVVAWSWTVFNVDSSTLQNPIFTFEDSVTYSMALEVTTVQGCSNELNKEVKVRPLPEVEFDFTPLFGVPPLDVNFFNNTEDGIQFLWNFGDGGTSNDITPSYIYDSIGDYTITLIAQNSFSCIDSVKRLIRVRKPILDIAVTGLLVETDGNSVTITTEITNQGTRDVTNFDLRADAGTGSVIKEHWTGDLKPGERTTYIFNAVFELTQDFVSEYTCVEALNPEGDIDDFPLNNKMCKSDLDNFTILNPYPNPFEDLLTIRFTIPDNDEVEILLFDAMGKVTRQLYVGNAVEGLNEIGFYLNTLHPGFYTVSITYRNKQLSREIIKE